MNSSTIKAIALDFDGTLVESNQIKDLAFESIFNDWPEYKEEMMRWHFSHNTLDRTIKFRYFVENFLQLDNSTKMIEKLTKRFEELTRADIIECPFVNGAQHFLTSVHGRFLVFLVSATPQLELEIILKSKGLKDTFNKVYGAPLDKKKILKTIIKKEKLSTSELIYIGDSPEDQECAKVLGVNFIGRYSDRALNEKIDFVFKDFFEIHNHIKKYFAI